MVLCFYNAELFGIIHTVLIIRNRMGGRDRWTTKNVRDGFDRFLKEFGRLPTASEVDKIGYLPSARQIQRKWGGLEELRRILGYEDTHFGKGIHRSRIAYEVNSRGKSGEEEVRELLCEKFHEEFVHIERPIDKKRKLRGDFYVFNPAGNFCVDVFSTSTFHDLATNINIKIKKYSVYKEKLYFLLMSDTLFQDEIDLFLRRKKIPLMSNMSLVTLEEFKRIIREIPSYHIVIDDSK